MNAAYFSKCVSGHSQIQKGHMVLSINVKKKKVFD